MSPKVNQYDIGIFLKSNFRNSLHPFAVLSLGMLSIVGFVLIVAWTLNGMIAILVYIMVHNIGFINHRCLLFPKI